MKQLLFVNNFDNFQTNSKADILSDYDALKNGQAQREKEENTLRMEIR